MLDLLQQHAAEIWTFLIGLIGGGVGGSLITNIAVSSSSLLSYLIGHSTTVLRSRGGELSRSLARGRFCRVQRCPP
jgi:hypothetical protein